MPEPTTEHDPRFTWGLIVDVFALLEAHGYNRGDNGAVGRASTTLLQRAREFEGADR